VFIFIDLGISNNSNYNIKNNCNLCLKTYYHENTIILSFEYFCSRIFIDADYGWGVYTH